MAAEAPKYICFRFERNSNGLTDREIKLFFEADVKSMAGSLKDARYTTTFNVGLSKINDEEVWFVYIWSNSPWPNYAYVFSDPEIMKDFMMEVLPATARYQDNHQVLPKVEAFLKTHFTYIPTVLPVLNFLSILRTDKVPDSTPVAPESSSKVAFVGTIAAH